MNFRAAACAGFLVAFLIASVSADRSAAVGDVSPGALPAARRMTRPPPRLSPGAIAPEYIPFSRSPARAPSAPAAVDSFIGLVDDLRVIPPDTMGAASTTHLVSILNSEVGFFTRSGTLLNPNTTLESFWSPVAPDAARGIPAFIFDPKVLYDQHAGNFVAISADGRPPAGSWILLARSNTGDPTGGWTMWPIPGDNTLWADFPGLGVDAANIYITANMFDNNDSFQYIKVWIIPKATLPLAGQIPPSTVLVNPFNSGLPFSYQPTHVFGTPGTAYIIGEDHLFSGTLRVARIWPSWANLGPVSVAPYPSLFQLPAAPNTGIDSGDSRILNSVLRNGRLYTTHTVPDAGGTKTEVAWYEILPTPTPALLQEGRISDPNRFYYYPSIAVNSAGDIAVGFSGSSATPAEYPGSYYSSRRAADPAGTMQPVTLLKSGEATYQKTGTGTQNRWGDFSATVVDPVDDTRFWTLQEYATTPFGGTVDRWATWWGHFGPPAITPPSDLSATQLSTSQIRLLWTNPEIGAENIVVEKRTAPAGGYSALGSPLSPGATSFLDNSAQVVGTTYFYRVRAGAAAGRSYSNEAFVTASSAPPAAAGGGGGGGCTMVTDGRKEPSAEGVIAFLVPYSLPVVVLASRRFYRIHFRSRRFRHPAC